MLELFLLPALPMPQLVISDPWRRLIIYRPRSV